MRSFVSADAPKSCRRRAWWVSEEEERSGGERTYGERAWGVARHGPAPATVERRALLHEDTHDATSPKRLRVHLALNLQRIEREQHLSHPTLSKHQRTHAPTGKHPAAKALTTSPMPVKLPAVACIIILPLRSPNAFVKLLL